MDEWQPASIEQVRELVARDLLDCDEEQLALFNRCAVEPYTASITTHGNRDTVVVVARNGSEVIYYEDEEDGFNVSLVGADGQILEHWCNQDELKCALNYWIEGRKLSVKSGPAQPDRISSTRGRGRPSYTTAPTAQTDFLPRDRRVWGVPSGQTARNGERPGELPGPRRPCTARR
jgi:hypothetical protein